MTTPGQRWGGPIQDAIREHDRRLGHLPEAPAEGRPVLPMEWFRRMPNGGTVFLRPAREPQFEGDRDAEGR